jgi:hypothetical protein
MGDNSSMGQQQQLQQFGSLTVHEVLAPQQARDKAAVVMVMHLCSSLGVGDDFREEVLLRFKCMV